MEDNMMNYKELKVFLIALLKVVEKADDLAEVKEFIKEELEALN